MKRLGALHRYRGFDVRQLGTACPCRKLKAERIDGAAGPRSAPEIRRRLPAPHAAPVRPRATRGACEPHRSISDVEQRPFASECRILRDRKLWNIGPVCVATSLGDAAGAL